MEAQPELTAGELKHLQRCTNDLISLLALPAIWSGGDPSQVLHTLLNALMRILRLDLVSVRLTGTVDGPPVEIVRFAELRGPVPPAHEICDALNRRLHDDSRKWPPLLQDLMGQADVSLVPVPLGLQGELGLVVAASERTDFPRQTEALLLNIAANQAVIGLQEARLLGQQKRVSAELDRRVAQRTAEVAAANEELRKEIVDRKRAEEALRESEQSLRLVLDGIAGLVAIMGATGEVEVVNRQVLDYFGRTLEEMKGWSTSDAVHPDDLPGVIAAWKCSIETISPYDVDHRLLRADGVHRWFHARGLPLLDADGRIVRWYVLLTDIDDRRRAEEMLRRSEALLAEVQSVSLTGGFSWSVDSDDVTFSEEAYRIFGFEKGTPVTLQQIARRVHPEDIPLLEEKIQRARNGGDQDYEIRLQMPDQSVKYLHTISHGARDPRGQLEYIGAIQDITRRRVSEEALNQARSELARISRVTSLGALTASIAHEVNQPLSGIITNAGTCLRMLAAEPPNVEGARETARRTIRDGNRASEVISRLRALFSKKSAAVQPMDLSEATREVIALSLSELQKNRVILRLELADDLPPVRGDRVQIQQVILNLLRNASDAMSAVDDRSRDLLIRTEPEHHDRVRLSVQDVGVGFEPQAADKLFEPFYTTKVEGMGIGLSLSRSIIERHHGGLWATPNDGPGVTFSFSIPCASEDSTSDHTAVSRIPPVSKTAASDGGHSAKSAPTDPGGRTYTKVQ